MFLDPDPKRHSKHSNSMSGFFSSQRPIESPKDHRKATRRKALQERSASQNNQQENPWENIENPTVRLVKPSPPQPGENSSDIDEETTDKKENWRGEQVVPRLPASALVKPASASNIPGFPGFPASGQDKYVSDTTALTNEAQSYNRSDNHTRQASTAIIRADAVPRTGWHRRSGSTGNYSNSSTLREGDSVFGQRSESRFSEGTTLQGTPTPYDQEYAERIESETGRQVSTRTLESLQETSPERSTVRVVAPSENSDSSDHPLRFQNSDSPIVRPATSPSSDSEPRPDIRREGSQRSASEGEDSIRTTLQKVGSLTPQAQQSRESIAQSEATLSPTSSPNFIAYSSPQSSRPRSRTQPLHYSYSIESIQSRLQYPTVVRPGTGRSPSTSNSDLSLQPSSSTDTLPPLQVPKKRLRHKQASSSLNAAASTSFTSGHSMADDDIDTLPYPRDPFSSHLSTIASESDRTTSQQLSHFSLGSGVLTGDDSSSIPLSGTWPRRRDSAPIDSSLLGSSIGASRTGNGEEVGDMTLGTFREESAKPQPLFRAAGSVGADRRYDGQFPPLPPMPKSRDSEENFDKVSELQSPHLREKRSGYSLRRGSTPSRSHSRHLSQISRSESDRWSQASSVFPFWAKQFYGHGAVLMSASKISLGGHDAPRAGNGHERNDSTWTDRSITSRLGTGYNEIEEPSPTSSHFLPSIFRPRTRGKAAEGRSKLRKSKRSRPSRDEGRPDSMTIFTEPFPTSENDATLPSGQPKYGTLKDNSEKHRPLPRKYSKQKRWDEMEFPRPMTKDRLSDFGMHISDPHLVPTKRSTNRLSAWRAPSFVESLDTLFRARGNRQILLFALGFVCPLLWMLGAVLPIPKKPISAEEYEKSVGGSEDDIQAAMMKHEAGDAERRWSDERAWLKARWWRWLNRVMSVVGILVVAAVIALAIVATR